MLMLSAYADNCVDLMSSVPLVLVFVSHVVDPFYWIFTARLESRQRPALCLISVTTRRARITNIANHLGYLKKLFKIYIHTAIRIHYFALTSLCLVEMGLL